MFQSTELTNYVKILSSIAEGASTGGGREAPPEGVDPYHRRPPWPPGCFYAAQRGVDYKKSVGAERRRVPEAEGRCLAEGHRPKADAWPKAIWPKAITHNIKNRMPKAFFNP
nr:hypothetical protein [Crucivirus sp.]